MLAFLEALFEGVWAWAERRWSWDVLDYGWVVLVSAAIVCLMVRW